ncbi:MAG: hypothetical protein Q8L64_00690 [bacterium]|nr:hypothetical protein [bacterium]
MSCKISEERTRKEMKAPLFVGGVDPQLERAGWYIRDHSKVKIEIPADGYSAEPRRGVWGVAKDQGVGNQELVSSGAACRMQIQQGTGVTAKHPFLLLVRGTINLKFE